MKEIVPSTSVELFTGIDEDIKTKIARIIVNYCKRKGIDPRDTPYLIMHNGLIWREIEKSGLLTASMTRQSFVRGLADQIWAYWMHPQITYRSEAKKLEAMDGGQREYEYQIEQRRLLVESDNETQALREVVKKQQEEIEMLKSHFFRLAEVDLNSLSLEGASWYCKEKMKGAPLDVRQQVLNAVAHGISMGWRKKESSMGVDK